MNHTNLCLGCMEEKSTGSTCPRCSYQQGAAPISAHHLPPGTILENKYLLGKVLGQGGFGITYIAWDQKLDMKLALKEYFPQGMAARTPGSIEIDKGSGENKEQLTFGLQKFLNEAKTLARFNEHPNIVTVRDYFEANGTAYLVMNYHEGITLQNYLVSKGGKIPVEQALSIFMPVLDALKEVHTAGILHRDISPDNIFIDQDGRVVLIDFGAARQAMSEKCKSLSVIMKAGYSPPEQYQSKGKQGPWTDIYAVAASLYHAITGKAPSEAYERVIEDNLELPSALGVKIDKNVENALHKALALEAKKRYQEVEEFYNDLYTLNMEHYEGVEGSLFNQVRNKKDYYMISKRFFFVLVIWNICNLLLTGGIILFVIIGQDNAANPGSADIIEVIETVMPAVVGVNKHLPPNSSNMEDSQSLEEVESGSGLIIAEDGYIVTNHHVIDGADRISVVIPGKGHYEAELIGQDPLTDLAVLKIDEIDLKHAVFGDSSQTKVGETVLAFGNPLGYFQQSVTAGIISAVKRQVRVPGSDYAYTLLQTDALVNPGNSGGPLVNVRGDTIGINTAKISLVGVEGIGLSIPSNTVQRVVKDIVEQGKVRRLHLGVVIEDWLEYGEEQPERGVLIRDISPDSAVERAGLQRGDIIVSINGEEIYYLALLFDALFSYYPGDIVIVEYYREGERLEAAVTLGERPESLPIIQDVPETDD